MSDQAVASVCGNVIFVSGIGENSKEIWRWEVVSGWARCTDLKTGRHRHCSAFVGSKLYILGGFNKGSRSLVEAIEMYDTSQNICRDVSMLSYPVQTAGCAIHHTDIYIFGGLDNEHHAVDYVQIYDTVHDTCSVLSQRMPSPAFLLRAALWETCTILLGRDICFMFDFETHTWRERPQFKTSVIHFGMVIENGHLFTFGGGDYQAGENGKTIWSFTDKVKSIPILDILEDNPAIWNEDITLNQPCLVHAYGVITLPTGTAK